MKLLNDQKIELENGEIKITMRPVTTSQQARLADLGAQTGIVARIDLAVYCLRNCIEKISVNDVNYEPSQLAASANISDEGTMAVMVKLGGLVTNAAFALEEDLKK